MSKLAKNLKEKTQKLTEKYNSQIRFIKYNYRIGITFLVVALVTISYLIIYNLRFIDFIGKSLKYSFVFVVAISFLFLLIILKTLKDYLRIIFTDSGEGSIINKSRRKK